MSSNEHISTKIVIETKILIELEHLLQYSKCQSNMEHPKMTIMFDKIPYHPDFINIEMVKMIREWAQRRVIEQKEIIDEL